MAGVLNLVLASKGRLVVTANNVDGNASGAAPSGTVTTGNGGGTATPSTSVSGGSGSYTYQWTQTGTPATSGPYSPSSATTASPIWSHNVAEGDSPTESWTLTVTDSVIGIVGDVTIAVTLIWTDSR